MQSSKTPLIIPFLLALSAALFGNVFLPHIKLIAFAPFLAIVFTRKTFVASLWLACLSGLVIDLLSSQLRFGLHSLNYCLTAILIFHQKRNFFEDKPTALSLYTALVSCASSVIQLFLIYAFDTGLNFSWMLMITDLILMPLTDGVYAFLWFVLPIKGYKFLQKSGWLNRNLFKLKD